MSLFFFVQWFSCHPGLCPILNLMTSVFYILYLLKLFICLGDPNGPVCFCDGELHGLSGAIINLNWSPLNRKLKYPSHFQALMQFLYPAISVSQNSSIATFLFGLQYIVNNIISIFMCFLCSLYIMSVMKTAVQKRR